LENGHARLREVRLDDAAALSQLFARPEVSAFLSPPPESVEAFGEWITMSLGRRREGRAACYAVLDADAAVAGLFMCYRATPEDREAEIGFALAPQLWGTGVFTAAADLYVTCLFRHWPIERLIGKTLARNHRGLGAMRKLGATIIEQVVKEDGEAEFVWAIARGAWSRPRS
jgi:RimJ/RimL family protein N-acetyltransferase